MATIAVPGKLSPAPAISAALFQQDHFRVRKTRLSITPKIYFYDQDGKTLAFVRNMALHWNKELRVFTDPSLSFELLTITPTKKQAGEKTFALFDAMGRRVGHLQENSAILAGMRRYLSEALPQTYSYYGEECVARHASLSNGLFSPEMEIDLCNDGKPLDRRLVVAVLVLALAGRMQQVKN